MKHDNVLRARLRAFSYDNLQQLIVFGILVLFVLIMIFVSGDFLSVYNINAVFKQTAFTAITGCAALLLIASGNIDISVGSVMAVSCVIFAYACKFGLNIWEAALVSMIAGAVVYFAGS